MNASDHDAEIAAAIAASAAAEEGDAHWWPPMPAEACSELLADAAPFTRLDRWMVGMVAAGAVGAALYLAVGL
jgi:hypothetical protein